MEDDSNATYLPPPPIAGISSLDEGSNESKPLKKLKQSVLSFSTSDDVLRKELASRTDQAARLQQQLQEATSALSQLRSMYEASEEHASECRARIRDTMVTAARHERSLARRKLCDAQYSVGYMILQPTVSNESGETWVWGQRYKDAVAQNRLFKQYRGESGSASRREDVVLKDKLEELERDKLVLLKEMRRIYDEDRSKYATLEVLLDRYVMMSLLGRGGFSEVWKAYDIVRCSPVAVKFHQVSTDWSEDRRRNYIRHAKRECEVHMQLEHPRVIQLHDVEVLDDNAFISAMEYSSGPDLDTHLKKWGNLREVDAKYILIQLLHGLRYLADHKERIIHYDLKPANILFATDLPNCLDIKITDFGLCKIIGEESGRDEIDLTSQGTGTYWYLPPECFNTTSLPRISTKVDVWALGVVFYQMLFGKRPFGEGMSQKQIWTGGVMSKAREVDFPVRPVVSADAKEFIRKCLDPNPTNRPDIASLMQEAYVNGPLRPTRTRQSTANVSGSNPTTPATNTPTTTPTGPSTATITPPTANLAPESTPAGEAEQQKREVAKEGNLSPELVSPKRAAPSSDTMPQQHSTTTPTKDTPSNSTPSATPVKGSADVSHDVLSPPRGNSFKKRAERGISEGVGTVESGSGSESSNPTEGTKKKGRKNMSDRATKVLNPTYSPSRVKSSGAANDS